MGTDTSFLIKDQKRIIQNLSFLRKQKCLFTTHFGEHDESFITTILDIDQKKNQILLDYGPKEYLNKKLLGSPECKFTTEYGGIKVVFSAHKIIKKHHHGQIVFSLPIPESIQWLERRKYYRIKSPASNRALCLIHLGDKIFTEFNLFDISLTGFSFLNESTSFSKQLIPNAQFEQCKLLLPGIGEGNISLVIRNKFPLNPNKPDKLQRIGCEFTSITSAFESSIQRFMQLIEIERRKKS